MAARRLSRRAASVRTLARSPASPVERAPRRKGRALGEARGRELGRELEEGEIVLLEEWNAGRYGAPDERTIEAIRTCARLEGMITDPVYQGKSMAALLDLVRSGRIPEGSRVLYAPLGGQPALNAYSSAFDS